MSDLLQKLTDELDVYSDYDKESHQCLHFEKLEVVTQKAALIDGKWYPKSQLKTDVDGDLYVSRWLAKKS